MKFNIMNESLYNSFDIAYSVLDNTPIDWDLNTWDRRAQTNHSETLRTNVSLNGVTFT